MTVAHIYTVAFQGIEAREVDVQVHIGDSGGGQFNIVGLADKAVAESRERVRAALAAIGLALPFKRIPVNLAPACSLNLACRGPRNFAGGHASLIGNRPTSRQFSVEFGRKADHLSRRRWRCGFPCGGGTSDPSRRPDS